jgi:hypothetical protein
MEEMEMRAIFRFEILKGTDHVEDLDMDGL